MKKTHYEKMITSPQFRAQEMFELLNKEILNDTPSYDEFISTDIMKGMVEKVQDKVSINDLNTMTQVIFHTYSFHKGMGRIYDIKENMAEMLLNTKLDVDTCIVKSPFVEIIVLIPDDVLSVYNEKTGYHSVYTLYINFREISDTYKELKVLCVGKPNNLSKDEYDDGLFFFKIPLMKGKVSESLKKSMEEWDKSSLKRFYSTKNDVEFMPRLFHFTLNVLLYITSQDCDIRINKPEHEEMTKKLKNLKSASKIRKLQKKLDKESKINQYVVGGSITLTPEEKGLYSALRNSGKHSIRYPVGGHWRMQWYGQKDSKSQRQRWIKPYFRGPELAELVKSIGIIK